MIRSSFLYLIFYVSTILQPSTCSDVCSGAIDLSIGNTVIGGTTTFPADVPSCSLESDYPGSWYKVVGNGNIFTLSTCSEATKVGTILNVFDGDCSMHNLNCVQVNELSSKDCTVNNLSSSLSWQSMEGRIYHILVSTEDIGEDQFGLTLTEQTLGSNDICEGAISVQADGFTINGNTLLASNDDAQDTCGIYSDSRGVWYSIEASSTEALVATTCTSETDYSTAMSVFAGTCDSLECIDVSEIVVGKCAETSTVRWNAIAGETYYILIHGYLSESFGNFGLSVSPWPENDDCEGTIDPIIPGSTIVEGTTHGATIDDENLPSCNVFYDTPAVWYNVLGTGNTMRASTCNDITNSDTRISVVMGSDDDINTNSDGGGCGVLTCVETTLKQCSSLFQTSTISWETKPNQRYYVLVHGAAIDEGEDYIPGTFGLSIEEVQQPSSSSSTNIMNDNGDVDNDTTTTNNNGDNMMMNTESTTTMMDDNNESTTTTTTMDDNTEPTTTIDDKTTTPALNTTNDGITTDTILYIAIGVVVAIIVLIVIWKLWKRSNDDKSTS